MIYPPGFLSPEKKLGVAYTVAQLIASLAPDTRAVVQAGGCSGQWPLALSMYFSHVYTFEPDPTNFACLKANTAEAKNISVFPYAVGDVRTHVGLTRPKEKAGLWRVDGHGDIPMVPIDDVVDGPVDAIVLDVEGSEVEALTGAMRLIKTYRPVLWFEYLHRQPELKDFMQGVGYTRPVPTITTDAFSVHSPQLRELQRKYVTPKEYAWQK